jgi:hypothetical protein
MADATATIENSNLLFNADSPQHHSGPAQPWLASARLRVRLLKIGTFID